MAKVKYIGIVESASGKLHKKSNVILRHFKRSGKNYAYERVENYQHTRSAKQGTMRAAFGGKSHAVSAWLRANSNPPTEAYLQLQRDFESQMKYDNFFTYAMTRWPIGEN